MDPCSHEELEELQLRVKVCNPAWGGPCEALATLLPCPEEIRIPYASSDAVALKGLLEPQAVGTAVPFRAGRL